MIIIGEKDWFNNDKIIGNITIHMTGKQDIK